MFCHFVQLSYSIGALICCNDQHASGALDIHSVNFTIQKGT
jgi:hypothetical protein